MAKIFEDTDLGLCVLEALVQQGLVKVDVQIPMLEPEDDDDLDDESESWRDRVVTNQSDPIDSLLAILEANRDKIGSVKEISGVLIAIAEEYEPEIYSLAGIEACTDLVRLELWTSDPELDLSPLVSLPKLAELDLSCAGRIHDLKPLLSMKALEKVVGSTSDAIAAKLRARNVTVVKR